MSNVRRYEHGSRVPGWDRPADLEKDPAGDPRTRRVPTPPVPEGLRAEIEAHMAQLPRPPLGGAAGARGCAAPARLVLARGDRAGRLRDGS